MAFSVQYVFRIVSHSI